MQQGNSQNSPLLYGLLLGLLIIGLMIILRGKNEVSPTSLSEQFVPGPTMIGGPPPFPVPKVVRDLAQTVVAKWNGGEEVPPLTPVAQNGSLEVTINSLSHVEGGMLVSGKVRNIGTQPITVPLSAFHFHDEKGRTYGVQGEGKATLAPGQDTPLDLTLPITNLGELVMLVDIPEANVKMEITLLANGATPTAGR